MVSKIEIDGKWHECGFLYPFNEPPIKISGPDGMSYWQHRTSYNAKLVVNRDIQPGSYEVHHNGKLLVFEPTSLTVNGDFIGRVYTQS